MRVEVANIMGLYLANHSFSPHGGGAESPPELLVLVYLRYFR